MSGGERDGQAPPGTPRGRGRPGPDPGLVTRAARLRREGLSDRAIGRELGVGHKSVGRWLAGQEPPPGTAAGPAEVARLREEPAARTRSWREIGAELGVSHETARKRYAALRGQGSAPAGEDDLEQGGPGQNP